MRTELNKAQKEAVAHVNGPMLVLAGPGSGKTKVITERLLSLINNEKIPPGSILTVTFSREAASEMMARFFTAAGSEKNRVTGVTFGTLHSVFLNILSESPCYRGFKIAQERQKTEILAKELEILLPDMENKADLISRTASEISIVKSSFSDIGLYQPACLESELFQKLYRAYNEELSGARLLDFDDILICCYELLKTDPLIRRKWQEKYRYILVDEFQDINRVQYETLKLLEGSEQNLFAVGDDDQSIYGFRGADPSILQKFKNDHKGCRVVLLDVNYRSDKKILEKALQVISINKNRFPKKILADRSCERNTEGQSPFLIRSFPSQNAECEDLANRILWFHKQGTAYGDMAVLFRNSFDFLLLVSKLDKKNIPYSFKAEMSSVYSGFIAQDLIAYLKTASFSASRKEFFRIMNRPFRRLSREAVPDGASKRDYVQYLKQFYPKNSAVQKTIARLKQDLGILYGCDPYTAISYIRFAMGYEDYLKTIAEENGVSFETYRYQLDLLADCAESFSSTEEWLAHITNYEREPEKAERKDENKGVRLMTMHSAKGLEFDTVFLPFLNQGILPNKKSSERKEIEEERRLFYVAMTRAKNRLFISWSESIRNKTAEPSVFLESIF